MKIALSVVLAVAGVWLAFSGGSPAGEKANPPDVEAGRKLLAETIDKPGSWIQICMGPGPLPFEAPVPVFSGSLVLRDFRLGGKEIEQLQANREDVTLAMVEALKAMDFTKPPKEGGSETGGTSGTKRSGQKLEWLSGLHLEIIGALNAVETLPELLRLEDQLHGLLMAAEKDDKAPLPPLDLSGAASFEKPGDQLKKRPNKWWESPEYQRDKAIFTSRVVQREILGMITVLLRNEEFAPAKEKLDADLPHGRMHA